MSAVQAAPAEHEIEKRVSHSDVSSVEKRQDHAVSADVANLEDGTEPKPRHSWLTYERLRPYILVAMALVILGWWISATVLPATRHRWIPQTLWAWFFIL